MKLPVLPVSSAAVPPLAPSTGLRARGLPERNAAEGAGGGGREEEPASLRGPPPPPPSSAAPTAADLSASAWSSISSPRETRANCSLTDEPLRVSKETPPVGEMPRTAALPPSRMEGSVSTLAEGTTESPPAPPPPPPCCSCCACWAAAWSSERRVGTDGSMKDDERPKSQRATVGVSSSPSPQQMAAEAEGAAAAAAAAAAPEAAAAAAAEPEAAAAAAAAPTPLPSPGSAATPPPADGPSNPRKLGSPVSILFFALGSLGARSSTLASLRSRWMIIGLLPCK